MGRIDILEDLKIPVKPYLEQFKRIRRWKKRLDKIRNSNSSEDEIPNQIDFIFAYFINCYHLRDFLISSKVIQKEILNKFFEENIEMQLCRDICNECKHCLLERPSIGIKESNSNKKSARGWAGVCLVREYIPDSLILKDDKLPIKNIRYVVLANFKKYDVFELADRCFILWGNFLKQNKFLK